MTKIKEELADTLNQAAACTRAGHTYSHSRLNLYQPTGVDLVPLPPFNLRNVNCWLNSDTNKIHKTALKQEALPEVYCRVRKVKRNLVLVRL